MGRMSTIGDKLSTLGEKDGIWVESRIYARFSVNIQLWTPFVRYVTPTLRVVKINLSIYHILAHLISLSSERVAWRLFTMEGGSPIFSSMGELCLQITYVLHYVSVIWNLVPLIRLLSEMVGASVQVMRMAGQDIADPAPLGLGAFALTTFVLSTHNSGQWGRTDSMCLAWLISWLILFQ